MANLSPAILILILIVGVIVALLIGYFLGSRFGGKKSVAVREATEKHNSYKNDVREHFERTSAIMSRMVDDYRDMYKHMAEGADKLAEMHPEKLVTPPPAPEAITRDTAVDGAGKAASAAKPGAQSKSDHKAADGQVASGARASDAGGKDSSKTQGAQATASSASGDKKADTADKPAATGNTPASGKAASSANTAGAAKPATSSSAGAPGDTKSGPVDKQAPGDKKAGKRYGLE